jgi:hypothetical protein
MALGHLNESCAFYQMVSSDQERSAVPCPGKDGIVRTALESPLIYQR